MHAAFTTNYFRLKNVIPSDALNHVIGTIYNDLKGQRWLAEVSRTFPLQLGSELAYCEITWIVQVKELTPTYDGKILAGCSFVTLANAMIDDIPEDEQDYVQELIPSIVENIQSQEDFDLGQLSPIVTPTQCSEDELTQTIHEVIDLKIYFYKYFLTVIHRDYDLEDTDQVSFDSRLNNRLQIFEQECNQKIKYENLLRYEKLQNNYTRVQDRINECDAYLYDIFEYEESYGQIQDQEIPEEKWGLYKDKQVLETERDVLIENLLYLESSLLTCNGPSKPRRSRVPNGSRGRPVAHVLSSNGCISAGFMQSVDVEPETEFQTHVDMQEAVDNLFEGETLFIRASKTTLPIMGHLHDLNESNVIIQGADDDEEVVIGQIPDRDSFITTSGQDIVLRNLTFMSSPDNTDGILRVEKGHTVIENCVFNCNNRLGIIVCPEATLTIIDSQINDCPKTAAIIQEPGARVKTSNVGVDRCLSLIEVQTYPKVELPEILDCVFEKDQGAAVVIRQLGGTGGEAEPIIIREKEEAGVNKGGEGEDKNEENDNKNNQLDTQAAGETMQSKPELKNSTGNSQNAEQDEGKYVFSVEEAKEWLQSANVDVKEDSRLTNIGNLLVI